MNRAPSPHPSPPAGERVPAGRVRGWRLSSWPRSPLKLWKLSLLKNGTTHLFWLLLGGLAVVMVLFHFPPEEHRFYPRCLFHTVTGLQCPGCGGLRAAHHLLHGEIAAAFQLNPLLVGLSPVLAAVLLAYAVKLATGRDWFRSIRRPGWLWLLVAAVVVFGVIRNLPSSMLDRFGF